MLIIANNGHYLLYSRGIMFTFLLILTIANTVLLILLSAMTPERSAMSHYELQRRVDTGDKEAKENLRRETLLGDVISVLRVKKALLLVVGSFLLVAVFGWGLGVVLALIVALFYGAIARIGVVRVASGNIYAALEPHLLGVIEKAPFIFSLIRSRNDPNVDFNLDSRQELQYVIDQSQDVLSSDEKKLVIHALSFSDKVVRSVMTPASEIASIKKSEFLGPLTLDDLHKTGHSHLPVIAQDIDHIVGILHLQNLLTLDIKRSVTAEKAMEARVLYLRHDQSLQQALAAFLKTHQHLFIVVNEDKKTVGVVTLNDVIEALIGRKIIDDFDGHESLRAVAERSSHNKRSDG